MVGIKTLLDMADEESGDLDKADAPGYKGPERRKVNQRIAWEAEMHAENSNRFEAIEREQKELRSRQDAMQKELAANTSATHAGNADIKTLLAIVQGGRKGIRFGMSVGRALNLFARWVIPIIGAFAAIWAVFHGKAPGGEL